MRSVVLCLSMIGIAVGGCSGAPTEAVGTSGGVTEEALSTSEALSSARVLPMTHPGAPHKASARATAASGGPQLTYQGGPLLQTAKVYTVFWGSSVASQSQLGDYFTAVTNSSYFDWLSEYNAGGMTIGRGSFGGASVDPSPPASTNIADQDIQNELEQLLTNGVLPANDANSLYMVYFPPGVSIALDAADQSCVQFCAYHSTYTRQDGSNVYYGVLPDLGGACAGGCGGGALFDNTTQVSSHEMIEAVTDPGVGINQIGWYDNTNGEIGDICNGQPGTAAGYTVQLEWSNAQNACVSGAAGAQSSSQVSPQGGTGQSEVEPNDTTPLADALAGSLQGSIGRPTDQDWSFFSLPAGGVTYDVTLKASGDATLRLYKHVSGTWRRVSSITPIDVEHVSSSGGEYAALVRSPSRSVQSYVIALTTR